MLLRFDFPNSVDDLLQESVATNYTPKRINAPAMDVAETENAFVAMVELPGVKKEDVKITFEKDLLTVEGVRKPFAIPPDAKVLLNEINANVFNRSIRIPVGIDGGNISAELENGILQVVLPKSQEARVRTIAVK